MCKKNGCGCSNYKCLFLGYTCDACETLRRRINQQLLDESDRMREEQNTRHMRPPNVHDYGRGGTRR